MVEVNGKRVDIEALRIHSLLTHDAVVRLGVIFPGLLEGQLTHKEFKTMLDEKDLSTILEEAGFNTDSITQNSGTRMEYYNVVNLTFGFIRNLLIK